jgi:hypothetical protein
LASIDTRTPNQPSSFSSLFHCCVLYQSEEEDEQVGGRLGLRRLGFSGLDNYYHFLEIITDGLGLSHLRLSGPMNYYLFLKIITEDNILG